MRLLYHIKKKENAENREAQFLVRFVRANAPSLDGALKEPYVRMSMEQAVREYNEADYHHAIRTLETTLTACTCDADRAMCACFLALFYYDDAQYEKAAVCIDAACDLKPHFRSALDLLKRIYNIINECRNDRTAQPDLIKLRDAGRINASDLDILLHNVDVREVMSLLDGLDRIQFGKKLEKYRNASHTRRRCMNMGSYQRRLSQIMREFEECAPREYLAGDPEQYEGGHDKQTRRLRQVRRLCDVQRNIILHCAEVANRMGRDDVGQKLLLFSPWHFYLAAYARYAGEKDAGETFHTIHRAMFPFAREIEKTLKARFPERDVLTEIGDAARTFGTRLAAVVRDDMKNETRSYPDTAADITWLFLKECGVERGDALSDTLYPLLYGHITQDSLQGSMS